MCTFGTRDVSPALPVEARHEAVTPTVFPVAERGRAWRTDIGLRGPADLSSRSRGQVTRKPGWPDITAPAASSDEYSGVGRSDLT